MIDPTDSDLPDPLGGSLDTPVLTPEQTVTILGELGQTVADCGQIVANVEANIEADLVDCLSSCNGDIGLCHACILGDIASYVNSAGVAATGCGQKIIDRLNEDMAVVWQAAAQLGIPPPGQDELMAALQGVAPGSENPPVITPVTPPPVVIPAPPVVTGPGGLGIDPVTQEACIPFDWSATAINNWAVAVFGAFPGAEIRRLPTQDVPGIWFDGNGERTIPKRCTVGGPGTVFPPPETLPGGAGGGTIVTTPTPPVTPPGGTIITVPTPPAGTTQPTSVTCPTPQITVNVPPCPTLPAPQPVTPPSTTQPTKLCPNCLVCYGDGTTAVIPSDDPRLLNLPIGAVILGCSANSADLIALAAKCGVAVVIPPAQPPDQFAITPPNVPGGNVCSPNTIRDFTGQLDQFVADATGTAALPAAVISAAVANILASAANKFLGIDLTNAAIGHLQKLMSTFVGAFFGDWIRGVIQPQTRDPYCSSDAQFILSIEAAASKLFGGWFGTISDSTIRNWDYKLNYMCPNVIPSTGTINSLYTRGYIGAEAWSSAVQCNGDCPDWNDSVAQLSHTRIGVQDAYRLWQLGQIDESQFVQAWKRLGIDTDNETERFKQTVLQYPGMGDLVRMMVRDIGDPKVVDLLGLDAEFSDKWADSPDTPLKTWGKAQGVEDSVARAFWRAHWQAPSPSQIFTWLFRLRPDDRDPDDPHPEAVVTEDQARNLLQIADYVPGLVGNYIAAAYRPISKLDIRRLWRTGAIKDEAEIRRAYRDSGYNKPNAEKLARAVVLSESQAKAKFEGNLTVPELLAQYRAGLLTRAEALPLLEQGGMDNDQANVSLSANDLRIQSDGRKRVVSSLRSRYFKGEFSDNQAQQQLVDAFMDQSQAEQVVKVWSAELKAKEKQPTVAMLCKWYGQGMISIDEYMRRVENLNYSQTDALHIVDTCNNDLVERRRKEIEAAQAKALKAQQASNRLAAQQLRQAKADARAFKLLHKREHKVVTKDANGKFTTTTTDTFTDKPDDNITEITQQITVNGQAQ